ncbi:hypothetical protein CC1G_06890 [Coprinopsis cinerea okayama7|uniref:Glutathione-S-transferase n=1 Tax=Coprinopsis cinerea (strain Okayama-7 / 130 / ATCC MYA-4618 / FGSC 9003) TaxID=240176 RepID=A8N718_COPC7|nr:hypothetical protein CC1G_06890 [Coprinopsis cinerea okayama7\|eukprot:XP_001830624.1 hypothetical protein CC1G_06890 [Coprinopsis cinerea okayama7\
MAIPDAQIHPVATGAAAALVEAHQAPQELVFYAGWFCPFVQRTWIALEEKKVPYQYKEVNPYKKEPEFLAINPKGLVPALAYKGRALYESLILCEFLEDAFPNHTKLLPDDPVEKAHARIWIDHLSKTYVPASHRLLQAQTPEKVKEGRDEVVDSLRKFSEQIRGPFFLGETFSLVDVAVAPWIARDYILREHRGFDRKDVGPKWEEYAKLIESRPSVVQTSSDREHLDVIYGRYLRDEAQSEAAKAIRAGRVIP